MMAAEPADTRMRLLRLVPFLWIALSLAWLVIVIVTDRPAWALAVWIAVTIGPIAMLGRAGAR
jgi:hypothetical protein